MAIAIPRNDRESTLDTFDAQTACSCKSVGPSLPAYSPSSLPPNYSDHPVLGERSLQNSLGPGFRRRNPALTFTKQYPKMTITLRGQEPEVKVPWYGRDEMITGFISCEDRERVLSVKIQVEGKLSINLSEGVSKVSTLVESSTTLWKKGDLDGAGHCPAQVEFAFMLPHTYQSGDKEYPLPPSFHESDSNGGLMMNVRSSYRIRVSVTKAPKNVFSWEKIDHAFLAFDYLPRSRSREPTSVIPGCLANIKALPNEWYQVSRTVPIDNRPDLEPITTNLFIPTARVYPVTESVPFHIQVSGSVESLKVALLSNDESGETPAQPPVPAITSIVVPLTSKKWQKRKQSPSPPGTPNHLSNSQRKAYLHLKRVRIYLIRQIRVELRGKKHIENRILAEGTLESVPPVMDDCYGPHPVSDELEYLSWMGELKDFGDAKTGGFEGEHVEVSDYVALAIGSNEKKPWKDIKSSISVKLVTDSWEDPPEIQL